MTFPKNLPSRARAVAASLFLILSACSGDNGQTTPAIACLPGETACGDICCAEIETCDKATSRCLIPSSCQAGETPCDDRCCAAGEICDKATSTCLIPSQCQAGETVCGSRCCVAGEACDAASSTCTLLSQHDRCYSPSSFSSDAFASEPSYEVTDDAYWYSANNAADAQYAQLLSVQLWPMSDSTRLTGTFDLSQEPFTYAECERCVLVVTGKPSTQMKYYLAKEGTLTISELSLTRITGTLSGVKLLEVTIDESSSETSAVPGGCEIEIPSLAFDQSNAEEPLDPHVEQCFVPESYASDSFRDQIQPYEASADRWTYRAVQWADSTSAPEVTLYVEAHSEGTGSFPLTGAEVGCPSCKHFVILEADSPSGGHKTYVSSGGTLVLTELSQEAMVGRLENVTLVETVIFGGAYTQVADGCSTSIPALSFSSRDATAR